LITRKQMSHRISSFVLLAVALFALAGAPIAAIAQASEQTSQAQTKAKPESVFKQEHHAEKQAETEDTQQYRHSASVQWLARLLHTDVETAATAFEYLNFAVIVFGLGIPLARWLPKEMRRRSAKLSADLEVAQAKTADANERLKVIEEKLAGLDVEVAAIRKQVEEEMRADEVRSKAIIEEETARIVASAEQEIALSAALAQRGLKQFAADLAIDRAMSQLKIDADTDRALYAEFAHDLATTRGGRRAKGDQN